MNLANRFNSLLHFCIALSILAFATADDQPLLALAGAVAVGVSWIFSRGSRVDKPPTLPRAAINVLVLIAILNAAFRASGNPLDDPFVSTLGQFLVFIALIKLLDRNAPRDDAQIITLSVFMAIAAVLTSSTFGVGVLLIVYVPTVVASAMMWQLRAGQVMIAIAAREDTLFAAPAGKAIASAPAAGDVHLPSGLHPRRGFLALCFSSVVASAALATAVFVLVPRGLGSDFLGRFGMARQTQIGFREAVRLGESGFLSENTTPVMDVRITTSSGQAVGGPGDMIYLRGAARDKYNPTLFVWEDSSISPGSAARTETVKAQHRWTPRFRGELSATPTAGAAPTSLSQRTQKITMRGESAGGNMFCLWRPVAVTLDREAKIAYSPTTGAMRHPDQPGPHFSYTVESLLTGQLSPAPLAPEDFQSGRIRAFTDDLLTRRGLGSDKPERSARQTILAIRDHLRSSCAYTLEMVAPPDGVDPLEFFIFDRKKGHCEYFASAMTAMCQSQGIPCRVVTGYLSSEFNGVTGQYMVRESDAHAWVEAFVTVEPETGRGRWETFEPSPQGDIERIHHPAGGVMAWARSWYDALEVGWSTSVVGFDNASTRSSRSSSYEESTFAPRITRVADQLVAWIKTVRADRSLIFWLVRGLPVIAVGVVGTSIILRRKGRGLVEAKMRGRARAEYGLAPFRPSGFYGRALKSLARAGTPKPDHIPPARFAEELAARSPEAAGHLRALAQAFYQSQFGGHTPTPAEVAIAESHAKRMDIALKAMNPHQPGA